VRPEPSDREGCGLIESAPLLLDPSLLSRCRYRKPGEPKGGAAQAS
jgi:hypothetical protein